MSYTNYEEHKKHFQSVPHHLRSQFIKDVMKTPQLPGENFFKPMPYPNEEHFKFQTHTINYHYAQSTKAPKAIAIFLHGLYGFGGNSGFLGVNITKALPGVNFYSLDFINNGKSSGECRGYLHSFDFLVEQAQAFVEHLLQKFEEKPKIFLVGQSLGGAVAFKMDLRFHEKYAGMIFLNPALREIKEDQVIMKKLGSVLGYLTPKLKLINQSFNSSTKYDVEKWQRENPHIYCGKHVPGTVRVALKAMGEVQKSYQHFKANYIVFQGGVDKSVDLFAPLDLEKHSPSKDKTTIYIKSMWHSVFYEEELSEVLQMCVDWLSKRI